MDKTTDAIAHFIGLFATALDEARLRGEYEEFWVDVATDDATPPFPDVNITVNAPHAFIGFDPHVPYTPLGWELYGLRSFLGTIDFPPTKVPEVWFSRAQYQRVDETQPFMIGGLSFSQHLEIEPPGSVAALINQHIRLSDNDYTSLGDHGLIFRSAADVNRVEALMGAAAGLFPFADFEMPGSVDEFVTFIRTASEQLDSSPETHHADADVFVLKGKTIDQIYVDGERVGEVPAYEDYRPREAVEPEIGDTTLQSFRSGGQPGNSSGEPGSFASASSLSGQGLNAIDASVDLETGGNTLVNSVTLTNNWLASRVIATVGDHFEVNAIIQINAWQDVDAIGAAIDNWMLDTDDPTLGLNIANFARMDPSSESDAINTGSFPKTWAITEIEGDLIILNWIEQFTFMLDNDISILSAFGAKAMVSTGDNSAFNGVSIEEIGWYYDLIVVGGSIYDANLIHQMNILFDDDLIGAVEKFGTTGEGTVSTSGNLLWNQASLVNIGGADRFDSLPDHYRKAAENLQAGQKRLPDGILEDSGFTDLGMLRVLYIKGDFLNLQYVKQTNVLGDSDHVALAMGDLAAGVGADWTISTGANTLVNFASIVDVDATGKTYVGGERYSDEILIQAELISSDPLLGARDPDALVNEAIVFLNDDMIASNDGVQTGFYDSPTANASQGDVMQSMLA